MVPRMKNIQSHCTSLGHHQLPSNKWFGHCAKCKRSSGNNGFCCWKNVVFLPLQKKEENSKNLIYIHRTPQTMFQKMIGLLRKIVKEFLGTWVFLPNKMWFCDPHLGPRMKWKFCNISAHLQDSTYHIPKDWLVSSSNSK